MEKSGDSAGGTAQPAVDGDHPKSLRPAQGYIRLPAHDDLFESLSGLCRQPQTRIPFDGDPGVKSGHPPEAEAVHPLYSPVYGREPIEQGLQVRDSV